MSVTDLVLHRKRHNKNEDVTPEELLRMVLEDVRNPKNKPLRVIVILIGDEGEGRESLDVYRCQTNRPEQLGYLSMAHHQAMHKWVQGDEE